MLSWHFWSICKLVEQTHQQVCIEMSPGLIQHHIKMQLCRRVVLPLKHQGSEEYSRVQVNVSAIAGDLLVDTLLSLDLKSVSERKLGEFTPLFAIVRVLNEVVDVVFLSIFDICDCVKLLCKSRVLLRCCFLNAFMDLVEPRPFNDFKLANDVVVQFRSMSQRNCLSQAIFHFPLQEDIQVCLELVFLISCEALSATLLLHLFHSKPENCLFQSITKFLVFLTLCEFSQKLFPPRFCLGF